MKLKSLFGSLVFMAMIALSSNLTAYGSWDDECCGCDPTPYDAGKFSASIQGGVTPHWFQRRGRNFHFDHVGPLFLDTPWSHRSSKFNSLFDLPWNVGVELGYMVCCRVEFFADFDYTYAQGKRHHFRRSTVFHREKFRHYRAFDFYLGSRYYLPTMFCSFTPFIGGKVGLVCRDRIRTRTHRFFDSSEVAIVDGNFTRYKSDTTISGGLHLGVNWDFSACASITLKAEAIWTGDWRPTRVNELLEDSFLPAPIVFRGHTGPIFSVPVTLGLRYAF